MVIIDEKDIHKSKEEILMDLIYESTGQRIPLEHVKFGKPVELDARPDLKFDPNTFIPARVNPRYDNRYNSSGSGFMYRRRSIFEHIQGCSFNGVAIYSLPAKLTDLLEQINRCLPYPIAKEDVSEVEITSLEQIQKGIRFAAHPESILWCEGGIVPIDTRALEGIPLVTVTQLNGFKKWSPIG